MDGTVNPGQSTRAAAADLGVDQSTVVRARRGAEASPETVTCRRSNLSGEARLGCDRLTHPASAPVRLSKEGALSGKLL